MGKLKKSKSNGNHAKHIQQPVAPPSPSPTPGQPNLAAATVSVQDSSPKPSSPMAIRTSPATTGSTSGTTSDGKAPSFASMGSIGRSSRNPPGVGERSGVRSASSASLNMDSISHAQTPSSSPPATSATVSSSPAASSVGSGSVSGTSALSLLRNKLEEDGTQRARIASETTSPPPEPNDDTINGNKLKKRRPLGDIFSETNGSEATHPIETRIASGTDANGSSGSDGVVEYESEEVVVQSTPSKRRVHYADENEYADGSEVELQFAEKEEKAKGWIYWGVEKGVGLGKKVVRRVPFGSYLVEPEDYHFADDDEIPRTESQSLLWDATELTLGLGLASILVATVGVEYAYSKLPVGCVSRFSTSGPASINATIRSTGLTGSPDALTSGGETCPRFLLTQSLQLSTLTHQEATGSNRSSSFKVRFLSRESLPSSSAPSVMPQAPDRLLSFLSACQTPTVILTGAQPNSDTQTSSNLTWSNVAWRRRAGDVLPGGSDEHGRLEDVLGPEDTARVLSTIEDLFSFVGADEEVNLELSKGLARLTILRSDQTAVLSLAFPGKWNDPTLSEDLARIRRVKRELEARGHELRNPLSGVLQNAEVLKASFEDIALLVAGMQDGEHPDIETINDLADEVRRTRPELSSGNNFVFLTKMTANLDAITSILICTAHRTPLSSPSEALHVIVANVPLLTTSEGRIADGKYTQRLKGWGIPTHIEVELKLYTAPQLNMGLLTITRTAFDLPTTLQEVIAMFDAECSQKGIALRLTIDSSVELFDAECVVADPCRIQQVVVSNSEQTDHSAVLRSIIKVNLLRNATKFTPYSGRITICLSASPTSPPSRPGVLRVGETVLPDTSEWSSLVWLSISVQDTGKGVTVSEMNDLFKRFVQLNPLTDQYGGSGLGLYLSKSLAMLHHGFIEVESEPGRGSSFCFSLPVERGTLAEICAIEARRRPSMAPSRKGSVDTIGSRRERRRSATGMVGPAVEVEQIHILVVEDNEINQKVLKRQLTTRHFRVTLASNGLEALRILEAASDNKQVFDLILMDIEMESASMESVEALTDQCLQTNSQSWVGSKRSASFAPAKPWKGLFHT
ncbi:hypothetical protein P7C70_g6666, partial [Phenoliferia sp. Uapishka_3]